MLTAEDRAILDFERAWWFQPGAKDQAIEMALGLSARTYYDRLLLLLSDPLAFAYDPLTVKRVSRLIETPIDSELAG